MAMLAIIVLLLLMAFQLYRAALGLTIGALAGIFNYWLVTADTVITKNKNGTDKNPLGGYLIRLIMAGTIITVAGIIDTGILLGALFGLTLEMQTYLWDAIKLMRRK